MDPRKKIIYRKVIWNNDYYYEYLFVSLNNTLCLPYEIPERYLTRIFNTIVFQNITCCKVLSNSNNITSITKNDILNGNGIWLVADDCNGKGAIENINNVQQFMSIVINTEDAKLIQDFDKEFLKNGIKVHSLYHGTNVKNILSILQTGLKETYGMLGNGVYLGTFWKASRFACFSQLYEKQDGAIIRVIVKGNIKHLPLKTWICACCNNIVADHNSQWSLENFNGICAKPTKLEDEMAKDGKPKYLLRNEEWCVQKDCIKITHLANISTTENHYNPLDRQIQIF